MNKLISICIPTYQRPQLLKEALKSCFAQTYEFIEIIIGDDSKDNVTENFVKGLQSNCEFKLRYFHNSPSLGQAGNVNQLFEMAEGDRLLLLHDDDLLLPNALSDLDKCWQIEPEITAAFGKQYLIKMNGETLYQQSEELNQSFYRTKESQGIQQSAMASALLQQFPNNGYMILTSAATDTKYKDESEEKKDHTLCDFDFGIRLASKFDKFYFLDKYTAKYRLTDISISHSGATPVYMYALIENLKVNKSDQFAKKSALYKLAPIVLNNYILRREKIKALYVYFSRYYSLKRRLSFRGLYQFLIILIPGLRFLIQDIILTFRKLKTVK